ncbi:hypothetical protein B0H14DRAFT_2613755 [Mycena olivaceomarginata]|nr:hypothetical protein B0H14DRAFT_2613755 [Mycena olivaceomarginata]
MYMASHRYFGVTAAQTGYFDRRVSKRGRKTTVAATGVKCVRFLIKGSIVAVATVMSDPQEKSITGVQNGAAESVGFETAPVPDVTPTLDTATAIDVEGNPQVNVGKSKGRVMSAEGAPRTYPTPTTGIPWLAQRRVHLW